MLWKVGTKQELRSLPFMLPDKVMIRLLHDVTVLDESYGTNRDYLRVGGYSVILETADDLSQFKEIVDYDNHVCEWADRIDSYVSALYILNDDFVVLVFMPLTIAPEAILQDMED